MALARVSTALVASLSLLTCFQPSLANPIARRTDFAVKDFHPAPRTWTNLGAAPSDHLISLSIGLSQSRFPELERHLYEGTLFDGKQVIIFYRTDLEVSVRSSSF